MPEKIEEMTVEELRGELLQLKRFKAEYIKKSRHPDQAVLDEYDKAAKLLQRLIQWTKS